MLAQEGCPSGLETKTSLREALTYSQNPLGFRILRVAPHETKDPGGANPRHFLPGLAPLGLPGLVPGDRRRCCADHEMTSGTSDEDHAPAPSDDAASCICGGAIKVPNLRAHGHGPGVLLPAPDTFLSDSPPLTSRSSGSSPGAGTARSLTTGGAPGESTPSSRTSAVNASLRMTTPSDAVRPARPAPRIPTPQADDDQHGRRMPRVRASPVHAQTLIKGSKS